MKFFIVLSVMGLAMAAKLPNSFVQPPHNALTAGGSHLLQAPQLTNQYLPPKHAAIDNNGAVYYPNNYPNNAYNNRDLDIQIELNNPMQYLGQTYQQTYPAGQIQIDVNGANRYPQYQVNQQTYQPYNPFLFPQTQFGPSNQYLVPHKKAAGGPNSGAFSPETGYHY